VRTGGWAVESPGLESSAPVSVVQLPSPAASAGGPGAAGGAGRRPPWEASDLFPPKPAEAGEYGWRWRGRSKPCGRDDLVGRCRAGPVDLVWTPDAPRMVPPAEVPWLLEPLRQRARADLRYNLRLDAVMLAAGIAYLYYVWWRRAAIHPLYLAVFLLFAVVPAAQDLWAVARLRRSFTYLGEQAAALRYGVWLGSRRIVSSYFIAAALVAVWAAQVVVAAQESLLRVNPRASIVAAGLVKRLVRGGEWWRLLTAELLHGHWLHVGMNLLSLLAVGRLVEVHASPAHVPIVFLFSALTASVASLYLSPHTTSVGASGAIMGLIGFLAVLGYRRRQVLPRGFMKSISLSIALTAAAGLVAHQHIDNAAHFGGLVGGVLLGLVHVGRRAAGGEAEYRLAPGRPTRYAGGLAGLALAAATFLTIWLVLRDLLRNAMGWT
jgi:membrane associated rhomboid family serine protease